ARRPSSMSTCSLHALPYRVDPADYFTAVRHAPGAVLLDAGRPGAQRGRYDLISAWPLAELIPLPEDSANSFLQRLREALATLGNAAAPEHSEPPFCGGLIGYLGYDFGRRLERLPSHA